MQRHPSAAEGKAGLLRGAPRARVDARPRRCTRPGGAPRQRNIPSALLAPCFLSRWQWFCTEINKNLIEENEITLPIQIKGKLISTINTEKGYNEKDLLERVYKIEKINNKINGKKILRVINVQDKIINIITS